MPLWVQQYLPGNGDLTHTEVDNRTGEVIRQWTKDEPDFKVKRVCGDCNHGWMNDLENRARPVLTSLIQGRGRTIYVDSQRHIATWAVKTAMMWQFALANNWQPIPVSVM